MLISNIYFLFLYITFSNHNITTPVNTKCLQTLDTDETKIFNTQSCSSLITNINYATTSNGSSFLDDKKFLLIKDQNKITNNINQNNFTSLEKSYLSNQNSNLSHAKSVDLNNQSPYRLNGHNFNQKFIPQKYITNTNIHSYGGYLNQHELDNNVMMGNFPRNYENQYGTYSFCYDNSKYFLKNNIPFFDYKCTTQPPQQFKLNYNDDKSIIDNLLILIKDQNGCRLIQKKLEEKNPEFLMKFYDRVKN